MSYSMHDYLPYLMKFGLFLIDKLTIFNISSLALDGRNVSKYSSSTPVGNQSSVILKKPLTSSELSGQRQSTTEQKLHQQIDSALSR